MGVEEPSRNFADARVGEVFERSAGMKPSSRLKTGVGRNPLGANGVEAALFVHGRVVETVTLAHLVCTQAVIARLDGQLTLLYQLPNFGT